LIRAIEGISTGGCLVFRLSAANFAAEHFGTFRQHRSTAAVEAWASLGQVV
jgi:hypothetical protein